MKTWRLAALTGVLAALLAAELQRPVEYTLAVVRFADTDSVASLWEKATHSTEINRRLCGPPWAVQASSDGLPDRDIVVLLLCGKLEDWWQNPQYVLEGSLGKEVASLAYGHFVDVHGCGGVLGRLMRWYDQLVDRRWAAWLELQGTDGTTAITSSGIALGGAEADSPMARVKALVQKSSYCYSQRSFAGPVLQTNSGWQHIALRSEASQSSSHVPTMSKGTLQMVLEPL